MLVSSVMREGAVTVSRSTPAREAADTAKEHGLSCVPVVDAGGRLRGTVRLEDLTGEASYVGDVRAGDAVGVSADDEVTDAVELMAVRSESSLPVLGRNGVVVGVVSREDIADALARSDAEIEAELSSLFAQMRLEPHQVTVVSGAVRVEDRDPGGDNRLARVAVLTVPGVRDVHWS